MFFNILSRPFALLSMALTLFAHVPTADALSCREIFQEPVSRAMETDPIVQLRIWEALENTEEFRKPTESVTIAYKYIPSRDVTLYVSQETPATLKTFMTTPAADVRWLMHPLNTAPSVPFYKESTNGAVNGFYSASRSMFILLEQSLYSFKLPTNRPHPYGDLQPSKADLHNDTILSMRRSEHVREVDRRLGPSKSLEVLTEVLSVADNNSLNGFSVRDLRPLQDGNYYLPAFSIAHFGPAIARYHNVEFAPFWRVAYAQKVGQAKALLLLRYGLQMKTPNAQNWLIQMDKNFVPTGKIFLRDIADSSFVEFVAVELGFGAKLNNDFKDHFQISLRLAPDRENSFWQMEQGPRVTEEILRIWHGAHDTEYIRTVVAELQIREKIQSIDELYMFLHTDQGRKALADYAQTTAP